MNYWTHIILNYLLENPRDSLSVGDICEATSITSSDILEVLEQYEIMNQAEGKYFFYANPDYLRKILAMSGRPGRKVQSDKIHWIPHANRC